MTVLWPRLCAVALLPWWVACGAPTLTSPADGGKEWTVQQSPHFVLRSDGGEPATKELARRLEEAFFVLENLAFPYEPRFDGVTEVVHFSAVDDLSIIGDPERTGYHSNQWEWALGMDTIVVAGGDETATLATTIHELTHAFVRHHTPQMPVWLNEGLAQYYETMEITPGEVVLGHHALYRQQKQAAEGTLYRFNMSQGALLSVPELRRTTPTTFYAQGERTYPSAWTAMAAYHDVQRRDALTAYLNLLQAGATSEPEVWNSTLGKLESKSLRTRQSQIFAGEEIQLVTRSIKYPPPPKLSTARTLTESETLCLFARVVQFEDEHIAAGLADQAAIAATRDPEALATAGLMRLRVGDGTGVDLLLKAYALSDKAPVYGSIALRVLRPVSADERHKLDAIASRLTRTASTPQEFETVAGYLLAQGRPATALRLARRSVSLDRSRPSALALLAAVHAALTNYDDAARLQQLAVNLEGHLGDGSSELLLEEYTRLAKEKAASP